jgi:DNA-binding NarL/FixJ family response regulator
MSLSAESRANFARKTVMIVDDHDLVAMSLTLYLRSEGLQAQRHPVHGRDGVLTAVATLAPGVILLDLDLGHAPDGAVIDGVTLVEPLCRLGWRVIALSATTDEPRIGQALAAGAVSSVPKTAGLPVLLTAVRRATQGVEVMRPEHRQFLIERYHSQRAQALEVEERLRKLSERESAVLGRLARGRRAQQIAEEFGVSMATTRTQIRAVLQKLEVSSQLEAVVLLNEYRRVYGGG